MENQCRKYQCTRGLLAPVVLFIVGTTLLLQKTGFIDRQLLAQWWPAVLIFVGGWLLIKRLDRKDD